MTTTKNWSVQQKAIFTWCANLVGNLVVRARAGSEDEDRVCDDHCGNLNLVLDPRNR